MITVGAEAEITGVAAVETMAMVVETTAAVVVGATEEQRPTRERPGPDRPGRCSLSALI